MKIYGEQWEDSLRNKIYPFDAANSPVADGHVIPDNFIIDAALFMSSEEAIAILDSLTVDANRVITLDFTDGTDPVGTATIGATDSGRIEILFNGIQAGFVDIDPDHAEIVRNWFPRSYLFMAPLLPHVVVVSDPAWRQGLVLPDGTTLTGEVYLVGDDGVQLEAVAGGIKVHAYGDPYAGRQGPCGPSSASLGSCLTPKATSTSSPKGSAPMTSGSTSLLRAMAVSAWRCRDEPVLRSQRRARLPLRRPPDEAAGRACAVRRRRVPHHD